MRTAKVLQQERDYPAPEAGQAEKVHFLQQTQPSTASNLQYLRLKGDVEQRPPVSLLQTRTSLTSFLHEGEKVVQELLPLGVTVEFVKLKREQRSRSSFRPHSVLSTAVQQVQRPHSHLGKVPGGFSSSSVTVGFIRPSCAPVLAGTRQTHVRMKKATQSSHVNS